MKKIRFLLVSNMYPGKKDVYFGAFIKNIEEGLLQNGVEVERLVIADRGRGVVGKLLKYIVFYFKLLFVDLSKYDVVQVSYPSHTFVPFMFKRFRGCKLVTRLHGFDLLPKGRLGELLRCFTIKAVGKSHLTVLPSKFFLSRLEEFIHPKDYFIYPSGGVDFEKFYYDDVHRQKNFTVGFVGRLPYGKGGDVLVNAVSLMKGVDCRCIFVGEGSERANLEALAASLGISSQVEFVGAKKNAELVVYYNKFDAFIFPTREYESFGNVAIEAMACKKPVIGSRRGALVEYIEDGVNGYLFEPGNPRDLADKLLEFHALSPEKREAMQDAAYNVACQYEKNTVSKRYVEKLLLLRGIS